MKLAKFEFVVFLTAALCAQAFCQPAQPVSPETTILQSCEENFAPDRLSPKDADACLGSLLADNSAALNALMAGSDRSRVLNVLAKANVLVEMRDYVALQKSPGPVREWLNARISGSEPKPEPSGGDVLTPLGLYPPPEKFIPWFKKYSSGSVSNVEKAIRTWDKLDAGAQEQFARNNIGKERWEGLNLQRRDLLYQAYASAMADKILRVNRADAWKIRQMARTAEELAQELPTDKARAVSEHLKQLSVLDKAREIVQEKRITAFLDKDKHRYTRINQKLEKMKNRPLNEQLAYLGKMFDLSDIRPDRYLEAKAPTAPQKPGQMTQEHYSALSSLLVPALKKEIQSTKAGDAVLAFYNDPAYKKTGANTLNLQIRPLPDAQGEWLESEKALVLSREKVDDWIKARNLSYSDLKEPQIRELSRYLSATFVHEATHQEQSAWMQTNMPQLAEQKNKNPYTYVQQMERQAFGRASLFTIEKWKQQESEGNYAYMMQIQKEDFSNAVKMAESPSKLDASIAPAYSYVPAFEGQAAGEIGTAAKIEEELARRRLETSANPQAESARDAARPEKAANVLEIKTTALEKLFNEKFESYKTYASELREERAWIIKVRGQLLPDNYEFKPRRADVPDFRIR